MASNDKSNAAKCPFPGMDPFLEKRWSDLHTSMSTYARDTIADNLPPGLVARLEEYVVLELPGEDPIDYRPDVSTFETTPIDTQPAAYAPELDTAAEPLLVARLPEPETLRYIKIMETGTGRLVTTVEYLNHKNKAGEAAEQFREKQMHLRQTGANTVEIDLLREGEWVISVSEEITPPRVSYPYRICVVRARRPLTAEMYEVSLREPLPTIRVPLRSFDSDIPSNLQRLFETSYARGGYGSTDYANDPTPELSPADQAWADELLRRQAKR